MQGAFGIWNVLLKSISLHNRTFLPLLVNEMVGVLTVPSMLDVSVDVYREAVYEWLLHFFTFPGWQTSRRRVARNAIYGCILAKNHWTLLFLEKVAINGQDSAIKLQWGRLAKIAITSRPKYQTPKKDEFPNNSSGEECEITDEEDADEEDADEEDADEEGADEEGADEEGADEERMIYHDPADYIPKENLEYLVSKGWKLAENWVPKPIGLP
jgi:hypothetical protein